MPKVTKLQQAFKLKKLYKILLYALGRQDSLDRNALRIRARIKKKKRIPQSQIKVNINLYT